MSCTKVLWKASLEARLLSMQRASIWNGRRQARTDTSHRMMADVRATMFQIGCGSMPWHLQLPIRAYIDTAPDLAELVQAGRSLMERDGASLIGRDRELLGASSWRPELW
jgi:hypothetical protein